MLSLFLFFFLIRNSKGSFPLTSYPVHFFGKQSVTSREKLAKPQSPSQICFASTAANKLLPCFPCCVASLEIEEIFLSSPNQKLCFKHKYFALFFSFPSDCITVLDSLVIFAVGLPFCLLGEEASFWSLVGALLPSFLYSVSQAAAKGSVAAAVLLCQPWTQWLTAHNTLNSNFISKCKSGVKLMWRRWKIVSKIQASKQNQVDILLAMQFLLCTLQIP